MTASAKRGLFGLIAVGLLALFVAWAYGQWSGKFSNATTTTVTTTCPAGYTCSPTSGATVTTCPAGYTCTPTGGRVATTVRMPDLSKPAWKQCLERLGILDKCRVRGDDVECRQSVASLAAQCGV